jgi:type IV secretory pathway VirJ component
MNVPISLQSLLVAASLASAMPEDSLTFGPFGKVHVYKGAPIPSRVALFVSGDGGWNLGVVDMARSLAGTDTWIVGIDIRTYFAHIDAAHGVCAYAAADFEGLSHFAQKRLGLKDYLVPALVGYSSGATLVYGVLAQAPRGTFAGAVSLGFCNDLDIAKPLCKGDGLTWEPRGKGKIGTNLQPTKTLSEPWIALQGMQDETCLPETTKAFVGLVPLGEIVLLPKVGHGYSVERNWMPQFLDAFAKLTPPPAAPAKEKSISVGPNVSGLPLVEVPATGGSDTRLAILLTGDGGWAGIDRDIAGSLAAKGISVVGWNSLKYFWERKAEKTASSDLARVIAHYRQAWKKDKVILVGYSLGADAIPAMAAGLPAEVLGQVESIGLVGLESTYDLEFHITDWVPGEADGKLVLPLLQKLKGRPIVCVYGKEEKGSLCPQLDAGLAKVVELPGGHHMGGDYAKLAEILSGSRAKAP